MNTVVKLSDRELLVLASLRCAVQSLKRRARAAEIGAWSCGTPNGISRTLGSLVGKGLASRHPGAWVHFDITAAGQQRLTGDRAKLPSWAVA